jgi:hypothetical protein
VDQNWIRRARSATGHSPRGLKEGELSEERSKCMRRMEPEGERPVLINQQALERSVPEELLEEFRSTYWRRGIRLVTDLAGENQQDLGASLQVGALTGAEGQKSGPKLRGFLGRKNRPLLRARPRGAATARKRARGSACRRRESGEGNIRGKRKERRTSGLSIHKWRRH